MFSRVVVGFSRVYVVFSRVFVGFIRVFVVFRQCYSIDTRQYVSTNFVIITLFFSFLYFLVINIQLSCFTNF